jgi:hypothetical protein
VRDKEFFGDESVLALEFANRQVLSKTLKRLRKDRGIALVIVGGARGTDAMTEWWARDAGVLCDVYQADWAVWIAKQAHPQPAHAR